MAKKTPFFWRCKEKPNGTILFNSAWEQGFLKSFLGLHDASYLLPRTVFAETWWSLSKHFWQSLCSSQRAYPKTRSPSETGFRYWQCLHPRYTRWRFQMSAVVNLKDVLFGDGKTYRVIAFYQGENSYLRERCSQTREHPRFLFTWTVRKHRRFGAQLGIAVFM